MEEDMGMKIENGKRYVSRGGDIFGPMNVPPIDKWRGNVIADWDDRGWLEGGKFRADNETDPRDLISEYIEPAAEPAPIDMSQNRVIWGLLTDEERAALENHSGPIEWWTGPAYKWVPCHWGDDGFNEEGIYRTVAQPVITSVTYPLRASGHYFTVTLTLHDGKPISGTVAV